MVTMKPVSSTLAETARPGAPGVSEVRITMELALTKVFKTGISISPAGMRTVPADWSAVTLIWSVMISLAVITPSLVMVTSPLKKSTA